MTFRPMQEKKATLDRKREWAAAVFAMYGRVCWIHLRSNPRSKVYATDPAHVIDRAKMGAALAYGPKREPVEPRLGRPLCRACHDRQGDKANEKHERFSYDDVFEATSIHNVYAHSHLPLPDREDYPSVTPP